MRIIDNKQCVEEICKSENISEERFIYFIKAFEKYVKSEIRKYDDRSGLDDFKMNKIDFDILLKLYKNTSSSPYKLQILLLYIYSYYKLDGISFDPEFFPLKLFLDFLKDNNNIHSIILQSIIDSELNSF